MSRMRGFFGIGVEGLSKAVNASNLFRSAHAFGASFVFTLKATYTARDAMLDTSRTIENLPYYAWPDHEALALPKGCALVGVEFLPEAAELPSFKHPPMAAYVLGAERGSLSPPLLARCQHVVRIPTRFCVNLAVAGALVMYDRLLTQGRFPPRPLSLNNPTMAAEPVHRFGRPKARRGLEGDT